MAALVVSLPVARADPSDCDETLEVNDPYGLVEDADLAVDLSTLIDVEGLVDDYTSRIDDAQDAEIEGLEPPEGTGAEELIEDGRTDVADAIDLGRSLAECAD